MKEDKKCLSEYDVSPQETIDKLDLDNKQSLVNLLFQVQGGFISCRRGATEILKKVKENG